SASWMPPSAWPRRSTVRGASNRWCWTPWPDGSNTMRVPSFTRRGYWIGPLIAVTIGGASWMLLRAPHPATESMPLAAAGSEAPKAGGPPWLYGLADARFTVVGYADLECPYCRAYFPALKR